jgi:two-component system, chemotaxis family, chemotaxis protein CheY
MPDRATIVIGDDSALARNIIAMALDDLDVRIIEAVNGNGVIRAINENKPDLVLLDLCMPFPDGVTVLRKIRNDQEFCRTPVIICSVENGIMERAEVEMLGVSGYLVKPLDIKLLREMVVLILEGLQKQR